jgi:hypothetical protein
MTTATHPACPVGHVPAACPEIVGLALADGSVALVSRADLPLVVGYRWHRHNVRGEGRLFYAVCRPKVGGRRERTVWMHRLLLGEPEGLEIDHINGDGLDNRRGNLRTATRLENARNIRPRSHTGLKGVRLKSRPLAKPWVAVIHPGAGREIHLGYFATPEEAARAYDAAAREHFGEFARLNFPNGRES